MSNDTKFIKVLLGRIEQWTIQRNNFLVKGIAPLQNTGLLGVSRELKNNVPLSCDTFVLEVIVMRNKWCTITCKYDFHKE